jgi:N-formylglutamate amidohydrolase
VSDLAAPAPFTRHGPAIPDFPVVIAVPHAGRHYPTSLIADAAVPLSRLRQLEDRRADLLIAPAIAQGVTAFVAEHARAWIDLNRDPREIDTGMIEGTPPEGLIHSSRARNGLGLVPRHIGGGPPLWRRKFSSEELVRRIAEVHKPYHDAIAAALAAARARFGIAILLDCHSMPPIRQAQRQGAAPAVVIGDRFGRSADGAFGDMVETIARQAGFPSARNTPYAGGYSLDLHGAPPRRMHALQIEIDRSRYLDRHLDGAGDGLAEVQGLVTDIFRTLCDDAQASRRPIAAE